MPLRTVVQVDAVGEGLDAALASQADAILLNLTDASRPVGALRTSALEAIPRIREAGKQAFALVNHPRTRLLRDDLDALVSPDLSAVLLSTTNEPQDVRDLAVLLREFELGREIEPGSIRAFPVVGTARGLVRALEIAEAAPRVAGLAFDSRSYARDIGARHEESGPRLAYARGALIAAAHATDRMPLVIASHIQARELSQYGFDAIVLPDATSVAAANAAFTLTADAAARAEQHRGAYDAARAEGAWVARHQHEVIDASSARRARLRLE